jgi:hypothetical protein
VIAAGVGVIPIDPDLGNIPAWLGAGVVTAAVATLAYIAKAVLERVSTTLKERRQRRAALVQLGSLLRATAVTFLIQRKNVDRLCEAVKKRRKRKAPSLDRGYEQFLSKAYPAMISEERELHTIIRAITEHMMTSS